MKNPLKPDTTHPRSSFLNAFTLLEVLTVIAIISVLMTAGAIGLGNITAGKGTSSAIASCESLFEEARTTAISKRCKARVMIDLIDPNTENYLRRIVIVHEEIDPNTGSPRTPTNWVLASRGYVMPSGTYFSKTLSNLDAGGAIKEEPMTSTGISASYRGNYAYYEFNGEGIFKEPGADFIIGTGTRNRNTGAAPRTTTAAARDFAGFVIWRNGRTSSYRSPDQMSIPASTTTF